MTARLALKVGLLVLSWLTRPKMVDRLAAGAKKSNHQLDDHLVELLRLGGSIFHPQPGTESGPGEVPWTQSQTSRN